MSSAESLNYAIQHDFLFQIAPEETLLPDDLPIKKEGPSGIELSFRRLTKMKSMDEFQDHVSKIPLQLFPPLLIIDYLPKSHGSFLFMHFLLFLLLLMFDRYDIHPEITFRNP